MLPRWVKSIHVAWYQSIGRATQLLRRFGYGGFQKWYPKSSKPVDHDLYILKPMVLGIPPFKKLHRERHSWQREVPICNGHRPWRISADGWKANAWLKEKIELGKTRIILTSSKISPTLIILIIIITTITIIIINILNIVRIINILIIIIILLLLIIYIYIYHSMTSVVFRSFHTFLFWFVSEVTATCLSMPSPTRGASVLRHAWGPSNCGNLG